MPHLKPLSYRITLSLLAFGLAGLSSLVTPEARAQTFVHPCVPLTLDDLAAVKIKVQEGEAPWKTGYDILASDWRAAIDYGPRGAVANVSRNPDVNLSQWRTDMIAAYYQARMWYFTGNETYAQKAHDILIDWAETQTSFTGIEANLDLGDYAYRFVGAADILRGTWPGWTQTDTDEVKALFNNVYWPALGMDGNVLGPTNKGSLSIVAGAAIAAFSDDPTKVARVLYHLRYTAPTGFINTLSNGEHGETGRDEGHSYNHILATSFTAQVLWNLGIDVFSYADNRLLTMAEYYSRENLGITLPYVPMGTSDEYYTNNWSVPGGVGFIAEPMAFSILHSAYVQRWGLSSPYMDLKLESQPQNADAFMYVKPSDTSTATPLAAAVRPTYAPIGAGFSNVDIGGATPAGSGTYSNGVWTVSGSGSEIWTHSAESFHFTYKAITGNCTIIARVEGIENTHPNAKAGIMIRSDLNATPGSMEWIALRPVQSGTTISAIEGYMHGWTNAYGGSNWETFPRNGASTKYVPQLPYWLKIERLGDMIVAYASEDGTSWATLLVGEFKNMPSTTYVGIAVCALNNGTLNTSTFSHVAITGGTGAVAVVPEAPASLLASPGRGVPLHWSESFGATSYSVKRATASGGPYETIVTGLTNASYVDTTGTLDTPYYYVVTASNSAGESAPSAEDSATPRRDVVYLSSGGTATASDNAGGAAYAFDRNSGSTWYNNDAATTGWIRYDFGGGQQRVVTAYDIITGNGNPSRNPADWEFQGSNDGTSWTALDSHTGEDLTSLGYHAERYFTTNTTAYRYYRLSVTAVNGGTGLELSELALLGWADLAPAAPAAPTATPVSANQIRLSWQPATDATSYQVLRAPAAVGPYLAVATGVTSTSYSDPGLAPGTTYYYAIRAVDTRGVSANSPAASAATASFSGTAISINFLGGSSSNGTPSVMDATESAGVVTLGNWNTLSGASGSATALADHTGAATTVGIAWSSNNTWSTPTTESAGDARMMKGYLDTSSTSTTTVTVSGLPGSLTSGSYSVYVYCDGDNGSNAKTGNYHLNTRTLRTAIDSASANFSGTYTEAAGSAGNYVVFNGVTGASFTLTAQGLQTESGPRAPINGIQIVAFAPGAPTGLSAMPVSASGISLSWSASSGATGYTVQRGTSSGGPYTGVASGLSSTTYTDTGIAPGTTCYYVVTASNGAGESAPSVEATATTRTLLQQWRATYFGAVEATGSAADTADPDGDALPNLLEYAVGTDPAVADGSAVGVAEVSGRLALTFRRTADPLLLYDVQATDDLVTWTSLWTSTGTDNAAVMVTVTDPEPISAHSRRFLRLEVTAGQ